jgi:hypothetical protein
MIGEPGGQVNAHHAELTIQDGDANAAASVEVQERPA